MFMIGYYFMEESQLSPVSGQPRIAPGGLIADS